ncbi:Wzz/FepE/Etk N-terminal domain-containing protein [Saccharibacillus sp. CPCC 101409]|uniref:Wzz/FepE/Etk N-terminal domain-containing protein n=1 Tax=Saccharibacillus sp. CPCC 101409 TaxID=3058041 RepID=UPI0026714ECE|nr:Wzz/FepE/Etk N-terminal domain-containing protein [Saccharibacillus sp. CPCC 101409]MDO3412014.1 Wzz/FepE/Etk N-terminal domain-containing protein [Saccharibacillus sp. CPCC 101409]
MNEKFDFDQLFQALHKGKKIIAAFAVATFLISFALTWLFIKPSYVATARITVNTLGDAGEILYLSVNLESLSDQLRSDISLERIHRKLDDPAYTRKKLNSAIFFETYPNLNSVELSAKAPSPEQAARLANLSAEEFANLAEVNSLLNSLVKDNQYQISIQEQLAGKKAEEQAFKQSLDKAAEEKIDSADYSELQKQHGAARLETLHLQAEYEESVKQTARKQHEISELQNTSLSEELQTEQPERQTDDLQAIAVFPASAPQEPESVPHILFALLSSCSAALIGVLYSLLKYPSGKS